MRKLLTIMMLISAVVLCAEGVGSIESMGAPGDGAPGVNGPRMGKPKKEKKPKGAKEKPVQKTTQAEKIVDAKKMFIYGIAYSPVDSVAYFTEIAPLDSAQITKKTKFLVNRYELSIQLKEYMKSIGMGDRTCCVVFNQSENALRKDYEKTQKKYTKNKFLVLHLENSKSLFRVVRE